MDQNRELDAKPNPPGSMAQVAGRDEKALQTTAPESGEDLQTLVQRADDDLACGDARQALPRLEKAATIVRGLGHPSSAARVLATLARTYEALGDLKEAVKLWEEAVPHASASGIRLGEATVFNGLGLALFNAGQAEKAAETCQKALGIAREIQDEETEGASLQILALAYEALHDSARQAETARSLLDLASRRADPELQAAAERHLEEGSSREESAVDIAWLKRDLEAATASQDRAAMARISLDLGNLFLGQAQFSEAAAAFDRSLVLSGEIQEPGSMIVALQALGQIQGYLVQDPRYGEYLTHMLQAAGELDLRELTCALKVQQGLDHLTAQRPQEAADALKEGLALTDEKGLVLPEKLSARELKLQAFEGLAFAELLLGHRSASEDYAGWLLTEAQNAGDSLRIGDAFLALSRVASEREDLPRVIKLLEQGLGAYETVSGTEARVANACSLLGAARSNVGDYAGALAAFQRMAEASRKAQDRKTEALALQSQGSVALIQGDRQSAERLLQESLVLGRSLGDRTLEAHTLSELASLAAYGDDHRRAVEYWQQAVEVFRRPASPLTEPLERRSEAAGLSLLARGHANLGEDARALELATAALSVAQSVGGEESMESLLALDARAYVHFRAGRLSEAEADAREALRLFEAYRARLSQDELAKAGTLDLYSYIYDFLQKVLARQGKFGDALEIAERGRARSLFEALGGVAAPVPPLATLIRTARDKGVVLVEYSILHDPTQFLVPGRIEGSQAVFEDELYIWIVRPTGELDFRSIDLKALRSGGPGDTLGRRIRTLLLQLEMVGSGATEVQAALRGLYDVLIAPIADLLPADPDCPVVLVPQGPLFRLPFTALVDPADRFLIERHTLLTAPSIAFLAALRRMGGKERWTSSGALVVGNPENSMVINLTGAEREAREIAELLGTPALLGEQATEAAVVEALPGARLVHIASHGLLERRETPNLPGALVLAPSSADEDGLLTSGEVRVLKLQADLVVLSACRTGQGRISSEGVFGLSRSFLAAGAAGVVMSLWRLDDEETPSLMVDFHRRLKASGDPARALRAAILGALDRGESPRSWGAFLYTGTLRP